VQQLLDRLAEAVDLPAFTANTYVTQTRAIEYLSDSVHAFAQKHRGFGLLATTGTINAVSGTKAYNLPDDFAALINVTTTVNSAPVKLVRVDIDEIDLQPTNNTGWAFGARPAYAILADQLVITDPKASYTLTLRYVPELPMYNTGNTPISDFGATTDYILTKGAIDQWVVLDSAIKIQRKQMIDPTPFIQARGDIEAQLVENLKDRNEHDAPVIRDSWGTDRLGYTTGEGW
jgi:hypothetical protein